MQYEAFLIHLEPKTLAVLAELIWNNLPREDPVVETELMNLSNEIRARLEKLTNGINPQPVAVEEPDWLKC